MIFTLNGLTFNNNVLHWSCFNSFFLWMDGKCRDLSFSDSCVECLLAKEMD